MDGNDQLVECTLDHNLCNAALVDTGIEVVADLVVLDKLVRVIFFIAIPVALPSADDA